MILCLVLSTFFVLLHLVCSIPMVLILSFFLLGFYFSFAFLIFFFTLLFFCFFVFWLLCSLNYNFTTFLFVLQYFLFFYFVCFCIFWCFVFRFCYKLSKNSSSLFNNLSALMFFLHICLKYETSSCQNVPCNSI